jgi:hypothetical protein
VSSAISEFREERQIAKNLNASYPFLELWVFEDEGASSASLEQSYQGPLERSDLVVFLLGADITAPVLVEVDTALRLNKRTLLILRDVPHRSQSLQDAIRKLDVKYASYFGLENFSDVLNTAIQNEIVWALQAPPQRVSSDPKYRVLKNAFAQSSELRVEPLVGPSSDNRFRIVELTISDMKIEKSSSRHQITVPLTNIADTVPDGNQFTVLLAGRIQWLTAQGYYKLFPTQPKDDIGIPKMSSPGSQSVDALQEKLRRNGYYSQWNQLSDINTDGYEVAYDDDGKYFRCEGRMRPGSIEILVVRVQSHQLRGA